MNAGGLAEGEILKAGEEDGYGSIRRGLGGSMIIRTVRIKVASCSGNQRTLRRTLRSRTKSSHSAFRLRHEEGPLLQIPSLRHLEGHNRMRRETESKSFSQFSKTPNVSHKQIIFHCQRSIMHWILLLSWTDRSSFLHIQTDIPYLIPVPLFGEIKLVAVNVERMNHRSKSPTT